MNKINEIPDFIEKICGCHLNKQNCRYWAHENPAVIHERCAVSAQVVRGKSFSKMAQETR